MDDPGDLSFAEPYPSGHGKPPSHMLRTILLAFGGIILAVLLFGWLFGT